MGGERKKKQDGAELGQVQVKLEVIVEVGVEDISHSEWFLNISCGWVGVENDINANSAKAY